MNNIVSVVYEEDIEYPDKPYDPSFDYPEFRQFSNYKINISQKCNNVYRRVRDILYNLGMDQERYGTDSWNPFSSFVNDGDNIVIKPNLVTHQHPLGGAGFEAMVTHASLIRPIVDYILLTKRENITVTICDVPLQQACWEALIEENGLSCLVDFYKRNNVHVELLDLRKEISLTNSEGVIYKRVMKNGDPLGYTSVDLSTDSCFFEVFERSRRLEITDYPPNTVGKHHNKDVNEYYLSNTVLNSDLFINIPKLKTHRKAGITASLKNLIGINGDKSWIAHHTKGVDEYKEFKCWPYVKWYMSYYVKNFTPNWFVTLFFKLYRKILLGGTRPNKYGMLHGGKVMEGNWYGNDTLWRTIIDLNNIIFFADKKGRIRDSMQRKYISIIDGVVGMEKEGPMDGYPVKSRLLIGGTSPSAVDYVAAKIMGFDPLKIPQIHNSFNKKYAKYADFASEHIEVVGDVELTSKTHRFLPSKGWVDIL